MIQESARLGFPCGPQPRARYRRQRALRPLEPELEAVLHDKCRERGAGPDRTGKDGSPGKGLAAPLPSTAAVPPSAGRRPALSRDRRDHADQHLERSRVPRAGRSAGFRRPSMNSACTRMPTTNSCCAFWMATFGPAESDRLGGHLDGCDSCRQPSGRGARNPRRLPAIPRDHPEGRRFPLLPSPGSLWISVPPSSIRGACCSSPCAPCGGWRRQPRSPRSSCWCAVSSSTRR